jgi:ribonuclease BN (tRNA processing enzyme)
LVARRAGVNTLVLTHLIPEFDDPAVRTRAESEMRETFDGQIVWGEDLMTIDVVGGQVQPRPWLRPR